jgi:N-acetylglucosaminyldiphosphoundecaprenol N-acetyl-beta-D-mannosaminyltransferase
VRYAEAGGGPSPGNGKRNVLGVLVDAVDGATAVDAIIDAAHARRPLSASALAVHGIMTGVLDSQHRYRLNHLDLVVADGQPVRWALNLLHSARLPERVYGPTLMLSVCEQAAHRNLPIYLYGSRGVVLESLARRLTDRHPGLTIAGKRPSRFRPLTTSEKEEVVAEIQSSGAAITFVGLGCPRQEVWAYEYRESLSMPILAVGAAFDFHAGLLSQAPTRLQRLGLEWAFRLAQEPTRLWRRYLLLNPAYVTLLVLQATGLRRFDPSSAPAPSSELGYG